MYHILYFHLNFVPVPLLIHPVVNVSVLYLVDLHLHGMCMYRVPVSTVVYVSLYLVCMYCTCIYLLLYMYLYLLYTYRTCIWWTVYLYLHLVDVCTVYASVPGVHVPVCSGCMYCMHAPVPYGCVPVSSGCVSVPESWV
jgi:hypothetical protein